MKALARLDSHLEDRLNALKEEKQQGRRIIGYTAGSYMPEELVLACNGIPLGLVQAGNNHLLMEADAYICRWLDPFWRSQVGYLASGRDPFYESVDLLVIPITDNHVRMLATIVDFCMPDRECFLFGVPHIKNRSALSYYLNGLNRLRKKLEDFTGVVITEARLKKAIALCNRERQLFREISLMRRSIPPVVKSFDFIKLQHGSFLADKQMMVDILESFIEEVKVDPPAVDRGPRLLFTGSTLARGDSKVMEIINRLGATVVVEEFAEGLRSYLSDVKTAGDLMANLAEAYFMDRICPGWFRPGTERLDFLLKLAGDYRTTGMIWYQLMYRESYKVESCFFPEIIEKKTGMKTLVLESEYDAMAMGALETRIETFIQTLRS